MPTTTKKLNLFKYNPKTDGKQTFNIKTALNDNFDKIDVFADDVENKLPTFITTAKTLEKLAVQNMYTTGAVSTDTQGYNQLVEMKCSTFDKSKFTVVGTPTITSDGIASGWSTQNYITIPDVKLQNAETWK